MSHWRQNSSCWEIWIDDVDGELAMDKGELARSSVLVTEYDKAEALSDENDHLRASLREAVEALRPIKSCDHCAYCNRLACEALTSILAKWPELKENK